MMYNLREDGKVGYSPSEKAVFGLLKRDLPRSTDVLARLHYSGKVPFHGQSIIGSALRSLAEKVAHNREPFRIAKSKRRGPHPISFWIEPKRPS